MKNTKKKKEVEKVGQLIAVKIYFTDTVLVDRIANIADALGLSLSSAAGMIIRSGIAEVERATDEILGQVKDEKKKIA